MGKIREESVKRNFWKRYLAVSLHSTLSPLMHSSSNSLNSGCDWCARSCASSSPTMNCTCSAGGLTKVCGQVAIGIFSWRLAWLTNDTHASWNIYTPRNWRMPHLRRALWRANVQALHTDYRAHCSTYRAAVPHRGGPCDAKTQDEKRSWRAFDFAIGRGGKRRMNRHKALVQV